METSQVPFSDARLADCAEREVAMRRAVYPKSTKLSEAQKKEELAMMQAIADRLHDMEKAGPLFKEVWAALAPTKGQSPEAVLASFQDVVTWCGQSSKPDRAQVLQLAALAIRMLTQLAPAQPSPTAAADNSGSPAASEGASQNIRVKTSGPTKYREPAAVAPVPPTHSIAPGSITGPTGPNYATAEQKETIIRLLNHPAIELKEKTKILLNINKLTPEKADTQIADLKAKADAYDGPGEVEGLVLALRRFVQEHGEALAYPECERLLTLCETPGVTASTLRDNLAAARQEVAPLTAAS